MFAVRLENAQQATPPVLGIGNGLQMIGIYATRRATEMVEMQLRWDRTLVDFVEKPMRLYLLIANSEIAVSPLA